MAGTAHSAGAALGKVDGGTIVGGNDDLIVALGQVAPDQAVALVQGNGDQTRFANVAELGQRRALNKAHLSDHRGVGVVLVHIGGLLQHQGDFFALLQLQQVDDVGALGSAAALWYLVTLQAVDAALVGHEQHIIMRRTDKKFLSKVVVLLGHALHAAAAAVLCLVGVQRGALDITLVGQREDAGLLGNQVLDVDLAGNSLDGGAALVAVLVGQGGQVGFYDVLHVLIVGKDVLIIGDGSAQFTQFLLDLEDLQTSQTAQLQLDDGIRLQFVKAEVIHHSLTGLGKAALAGADGSNDFIDDVDGLMQTFQDMLALLGLLQIKGSAAADDLHLELNIAFHHGFQAHNLGHAVIQRQHDDTNGVLQLGVTVQLVQHDLGVGILFDLDDDLHAGTAGRFIVQVADALDTLILHEVRDGFDQAGLVDHVRDLVDEDLVAAVFLFDDFGTASQRDFSAASGVSGTDARAAHDDAAGGEIGPFDVLHQARQVDLRVIDEGDHTVDDLAQVMGRNIGSHANRDALTAVDQQVRKAAGQDVGFLFSLIKVGVPIDGILVNIRQHLAGHFGHAGLSITVSSRGVAVHGTKVALAVNQRITQAEILCQTHHRVIHTGVAVGVVSTQHSTNRIRRLAVRVAGVVAALVHRVQDAAVYGLQAIAHIRQGTGYDNGHGIIQKCRFDLLLDIAHNDLRARTGHHDNIFFHSTHLSDCFKALLQKLHRKSSLYHQNIKNKIHQRLAAAEISTVIRGGNRLPTRSGRTMCAPTGAAIRPAP